jgi:sialic acid synthase SpsE
LRTIPDMRERFDAVIGLSDHTPGTTVPVAAITLGAAIIEKHVTLRRTDGGPDAAFSLEPEELTQLCADCRTAFDALGQVSYERAESEKGSMVFRRSLYIVEDVAAGEALTDQHVRSIRPGYGLPPKHLNAVIGRTAARDIKKGTPLAWALLEGGDPAETTT